VKNPGTQIWLMLHNGSLSKYFPIEARSDRLSRENGQKMSILTPPREFCIFRLKVLTQRKQSNSTRKWE